MFTLCRTNAPDGGLFVPDEIPCFSEERILELEKESFHGCVAAVLNAFFDSNLSGWDLDFSVGRHPVRLLMGGHKLVIAESWHNPDWHFSRFVQSITDRICADSVSGFWAETAVRTAVLVAICIGLKREKLIDSDHPLDISILSGDFSAPISAWYARELGMDIGAIICCCNINSSIWELIHQGQLKTDAVCQETTTPDADISVPRGLEQMIWHFGGFEETAYFCKCCQEGAVYEPSEEVLALLRKSFSVSVVGDDRVKETITGFFQKNGSYLSPYTALAYAGMQDYRVGCGEYGQCLVLSERGPEHDSKAIALALGISEAELIII